MMRSSAVSTFIHSDPSTVLKLKDEWDSVKRGINGDNFSLIADELQKKWDAIDSLLSAYFDCASNGFIVKVRYSKNLEELLANIDRLVSFVDDFILWSVDGSKVVEKNIEMLGIRHWMMIGCKISNNKVA
jgi:hypothetical protein